MSKSSGTNGTDGFFIKAGIAGSVCALVSASLNGLDVTKIRMQNQSSVNIKYTGLIPGIRIIFQEEGFGGLSKGVVASMMREICYSSIRMGAYEPIRHLLTHEDVDPAHTSPLIKYFSALISGGVGSALANPFDLIKTRFQSQLPGEALPYKNTFSAFPDIVEHHGFRGLYKGWIVTSSRAAVLTSAQLGSYDSIKNNLLIKFLGLEEGFHLHLLASMTAGVITTTAANPFDVIKTRYLSDDSGKYRSIGDCIVKTFKTEGIQGFFKGWMPAYWRLGPHTVVSLLLIEKIRSLFGLKNI